MIATKITKDFQLINLPTSLALDTSMPTESKIKSRKIFKKKKIVIKKIKKNKKKFSITIGDAPSLF